MAFFDVTVTDRQGKYASKTYRVRADEECLAYAEATNRFITDNKHPKIKNGQRLSAYYGRFWNTAKLA